MESDTHQTIRDIAEKLDVYYSNVSRHKTKIRKLEN